jgi:hypothetical protein
MYPELFRIGSFPVNTYGLLLAVGMLLALFAAAKLAARDGLPRERIYDLGLWTLIGGLVGSKILMVFTEENVQIFSLDFLRSGGVYYGGFLGGFFALVALVRWYKLPFWKVGRRLCARRRFGTGARAARLFRGWLLLGKTDRFRRGRSFHRTRARIYRRSRLRTRRLGFISASDATL